MEKRKIQRLIVAMMLLFTSFIVMNGSVAAKQPNTDLTIIETHIFEGEETTVLALTDKHTILVENSHVDSHLSINNEQVNNIEHGFIERITEVTNAHDHYLIVEYRYHGSGSILKFDIVKLSAEKWESVYQSNEFPRGKMTVLKDYLELATPMYEEEDSFATPSKVFVQQFMLNEDTVKINNQEIVSINEFNKKYEIYENPFQIFSTPSLQNPSAAEINRMLTERALANNVPPELLKAIAWQESRWRQFHNGEPLIGFDGRGIGIMQVTPGVTGIREIDENLNGAVDRLKTDIVYNIEMGIRILLQKWNWTGNILPRVNDGSWEIIDNWYFATIAYNGISAINDPNFNTSTSYPPFQSHIYRHLRTNGLLSISDFPINELNIFYNSTPVTNRSVMRFSNKMQYDLFGPMTKTKHLFTAGDKVRTTAVDGLTLRDAPGGNIKYSNYRTIPRGEIITITGNFKFQNNNSNHFVWYPVRVRDGNNERTGYVASSYLVEAEQRVYGQTRHETAVLVSQQGWHSANTVVLARGDDFPDALSGAPLAHSLNAPMLLTRTDRLPAVTRREIQRLGATNVVILGGPLAISTHVETELRNMGLQIDRINGSTRFDTAKLIADRIGTQHEEVIVINVDAFADAMAIAPYAARNRVPILLTNKDSIPTATRSVLNNANKTILLGGNLVISNSIASQMPNVRRFAGNTRYDTSAQIVRELNSSKNNAFLVSGLDFPDGLTGAVLAAANRGDAILLTDRDTLPTVTRNLMSEFNNVKVIGGPLAISENVVIQILNR